MPILINETYAFLEEVKTKNVIKINDWEWRKLFIGYSGVLRLYQSSKEPSKHYILLKSPNGDYIRTGKGDFSIIDGKYVLSTINSLYTFVPYTKKMRKIIYRNVICCKHCNDIIESTFTHDYVECKCGRCSVDGGKDYLRRSFVEKDDFLELAVCLYADEKWNELTVDYKEIWKKLVDCNMIKADLREQLGISQGCIAKMGKKNPIKLDTIFDICRYLKMDFVDAIRIVRENKLETPSKYNE